MKFVALALSAFLVVVVNVNLSSGHEIPCSEEAVEFQKSVLVDFDGFDDDYKDVTRIDWQALEVLFMNSYNLLSSALCDDVFRQVQHVTVERDENDSKIIKRGGDLYSIRFTVQGTCRGCDPDTMNLFSPPDVFARQLGESQSLAWQDAVIDGYGTISEGVRFLKSSKSSKSSKSTKSSKSSKKAKSEGKGKGSNSGSSGEGGDGGEADDDEVDGVEMCKCESRDPEYRPPTEDEFRIVFDSAIRDAKDSALPPRRGGVSVDYVIKVTETVGVEPCSEVVEEFTTLVSVEFYGIATDVTEVERKVLEENFVYTYNGLQAHRCDLLFRTASSAEIVLQGDPEEEKVFIYIFQVDGTCRGLGCSANLTLFEPEEEATSRRLHFEEGNGGWAHAEPESDCTCPLFATEFTAPTTDDFEARFFVVVQELKTQGRLPNVSASGEVIELPFNQGPTAAPSFASEAPTLEGQNATDAPGVPTVSPGISSIPTLSPAPSESDGDRDIPTVEPNATDTSAPTASPVVDADTPSPTLSDNQEDSEAPTATNATETEAPSLSPAPSVVLDDTPAPTVVVDDTPGPTVVVDGTPAPTVASNETDSSAPTVFGEFDDDEFVPPSNETDVSEAPSTTV